MKGDVPLALCTCGCRTRVGLVLRMHPSGGVAVGLYRTCGAGCFLVWRLVCVFNSEHTLELEAVTRTNSYMPNWQYLKQHRLALRATRQKAQGAYVVIYPKGKALVDQRVMDVIAYMDPLLTATAGTCPTRGIAGFSRQPWARTKS
ncbi:hypothetical protein AG1IA_01108 [Rhizoctonia solani AG-1 IA]|uniref:Uncharacterized protein n=1 Tax=Thanatephorus cucumeris (strain AG1-IA) TaxID=983506 RepID=L8X3T6_THACA|nr:hypothetical protein AG1IA_01108 [Rhizoctonia solani AG-1 IA]